MSDTDVITGHCLCGTVRYEIRNDPLLATICHCSRCRRITGCASEISMMIHIDQLTVTAGADNIEVYRTPGFANRSFCQTCGSKLFSDQWPEGPRVAVQFGTLDDDPGIRPSMHIHVASKASWEEILDDLPQVPESPSSESSA